MVLFLNYVDSKKKLEFFFKYNLENWPNKFTPEEGTFVLEDLWINLWKKKTTNESFGFQFSKKIGIRDELPVWKKLKEPAVVF